jgi:hypothetical protein
MPKVRLVLICTPLRSLIALLTLALIVSTAAISPVELTVPTLHFVDAATEDKYPSFGAVRSVQVCPFDRDLILVGGCGGENYLKVRGGSGNLFVLVIDQLYH